MRIERAPAREKQRQAQIPRPSLDARNASDVFARPFAASIRWAATALVLALAATCVSTPLAAAPAITQQPAAGVETIAGQAFNLTVAATGAGTLAYQWQREGVVVAGATGPTLAVASAQASDDGYYAVVVTETGGASATSNAARVRVQPVTYADGLRARPTFAPQFLKAGAEILAVAPTPTGGFVVGGDFWNVDGVTRTHLARFDAAGALDPTFAPPVIGGLVRAIVVQPDGRVVIGGDFNRVGGELRNCLARLNADGSLDTGFGSAQALNASVHALLLQPDGAIMAGGNFSSHHGLPRGRIVRLSPDGGLDATFNPGNGFNGWVRALARQSDGKTVVGGAFTSFQGLPRLRIARLNADGTLDGAFNTSAGFDSMVLALAIQSDGGVLAGGEFTQFGATTRTHLARLTSAGALDPVFTTAASPGGWVCALTRRGSGDILVGGYFSQIQGQARKGIAQIKADGSLDSAFAPSSEGAVLALALQADGTAVAGGYTNLVKTYDPLARYTPAGAAVSPAPAFARGGAIHALARQADGRWLVGGDFENVDGQARPYVARLRADGALDPTFGADEGPDYPVREIAIQADGRIVIAGSFSRVDGVWRPALARLLADGALDTGFAAGGGPNGEARALAALPDGRLYVGGEFSQYGATGRGRVARVLPGGTLDASFDPGAGFDRTVETFALQSDGRLLAGGSFTKYRATTRYSLARLDEQGGLDATFAPEVNGTVHALLPTDNAIHVGGQFDMLRGVTRNHIGRLTPAGALDTAFAPPGGFDRRVGALLLERSGRLLVGGQFDAANGAARPFLARLNATGTTDAALEVAGMEPVAGGGFNRLVRTPEGWIAAAGTFVRAAGHAGGQFLLFEAAGAPVIATQPTGSLVAAGQATTLSVAVGNAAEVSYQWRKNGIAIPGATSAALTLSNVSASDEAHYTALVSNAAGSTESGVAALVVTSGAPPTITTQPPAALTPSIGSSGFPRVVATGDHLTYQWRKNGVPISGATGDTLSIFAQNGTVAGVYTVVVSSPSGSVESTGTVVGLRVTGKVVGDGYEFAADIKHPNGNVYDQVLLTGGSSAIAADPGQVVRASYVDLSDDIVQIEFSGAGWLTITLEGATGPALAANYNQPGVQYMKGHATLTLVGADETTHVSVFTVGPVTAVNQGLFKAGVVYDGVADVASLGVWSATGRLGSLRLANAEFSGAAGFAGVHAAGVRIGGPANIHNLSASGAALPVLLTGVIDAGRIGVTGGDMFQPNGRRVRIGDAQAVAMLAGATSHGVAQPAQTNRGVYERNGEDVTAQVVQGP